MLPRGLPRPRAILKDWDGTIVDSLHRVHEVQNQVLRENGWPEVDYATTVRMTAYGTDAGATILGMSLDEARRLGDQFAQRFFVFTPDFKMMAGAHEFVATFGGRLPMGIVSNKEGSMLRQEIAHLGWDSHFTAVMAHKEAPENKPSPVPALHALTAMGIAPGKDIWFVGDTHGDIMCAQAAGLTAILISDHDYQGPEPCFRFPDLHALLNAYHELGTDHITAAAG